MADDNNNYDNENTNDNKSFNDIQQQRRLNDYTWVEYRQLIISELNRLNTTIIQLNNRLDRNFHEFSTEFSKIKIDIAMLQIKSGIWGGLAGAVIALAAVLVRYISVSGH
jgi:hypothetical protein